LLDGCQLGRGSRHFFAAEVVHNVVFDGEFFEEPEDALGLGVLEALVEAWERKSC